MFAASDDDSEEVNERTVYLVFSDVFLQQEEHKVEKMSFQNTQLVLCDDDFALSEKVSLLNSE